MTTRRRFTGEFKARVALEALRGDKTVQEIASKHKVHPNQVSSWKRQAIDGLGEVFSNGADRERQDRETEVGDLHAKIGQLTVERDFWPAGSSDEPGEAQGDDRARPPRLEREPSMPASVDQPFLVLLRAPGREPGEPGADAPDR